MSQRRKRRELISNIKNGKRFDAKAFRYNTDFDFDTFLSLFQDVPKSRLNHIFFNPLPKSLTQLDKITASYQAGSIVKELDWYFLRSIKFSEEINLFLAYKHQFEIALLNSDYEYAGQLLDKIDQEVCYSFWVLKARLLLAEFQFDTEKNKEVLANISAQPVSKNTKTLLYYTSLRFEIDLTSAKYDSYVDFHLKKYATSYPKHLADYVKFTFLPIDINQRYELDFVLAQNVTYSAVDTYIELKKIVCLIAADNFQGVDSSYIEKSIRRLLPILKDRHLENLYKKFNQTFNVDEDSTFTNAVSLLINGHIETAYKKIIDRLSQMPNDYNLYVPLVFSAQYLQRDLGDVFPTSSLLGKLLDALTNVFKKTSNHTENIEYINKLYYVFEILDFHLPLRTVWSSETSICTDRKERYLHFLLNQSLSLDDLSFFADEIEKPEPVTLFKLRCKVEMFLEKGAFEEAWRVLQNPILLDWSVNNLNEKGWYAKNKLLALIELDRLGEAADTVVDFFFDHGKIFDYLISNKLVSRLQDLDGEAIYKNSSIPILFSIYNLSSSQIYDSIANFLIHNDLSSPSEIISKLPDLERERKYFLLNQVCTINNIQDSPYLSTIEKVEEERIKILSFLKSDKPEKIEQLNDEIFEITQNATVRECLKSLYDSRIYVDTQSLKTNLIGNLSDYFERYLGIEDFTFQDYSLFTFNKGKDNETTSKLQSYITYFDPPVSEHEYDLYCLLQETGVKLLRDSIVPVPYSRYLAFRDIFLNIKNEFLFNEDYGLKFFLSMRIRHGTLPNLLKNVFERHSLMINEGIGRERTINHWAEKIGELADQSNLDKFIELLENFTADIDNITAEGVSWVKIKESEADNQSMFDFSISESDMLYTFRNELGHIDRFDTLIDKSFENLWRQVSTVLEKLKSRFKIELLDRYLSRIESLGEEIDQLFGGVSFNYAKDALVTVKTDIQSAIYKSLGWFNISKSKSIGEIPITAIVQTSHEYLNIINADIFRKSINYSQTITFDENIKGEFFGVLCDLFNTLLDNVIKHTRSLLFPSCTLSVSKEESDLVIDIKNDYIRNYSEEELKEWSSTLNNKNNKHTAAFEDKSGFPKLKKILSNDLNFLNYEFSLSSEGESFRMIIKIKYSNLIICAA